MKHRIQRYLSISAVLAASAVFTPQVANAQDESSKTNKENQVYICDICGNVFDRTRLDEHFAETARQAAAIKGVEWSGRLVTFNADGKAWCPHCFPNANSMRSGSRTVHAGKKETYLRAPSVEISYDCKCGRKRTFNSQSVNILTGAEVICPDCGAILCVPPTIFDHSQPSQSGEAKLRANYKEQMKFVKYTKAELEKQLKQGVITEPEFKDELRRRGL